MSIETSAGGRCQFSVEKAYIVKARIPSSRESVTASLTDWIPARWPASRGRPCRSAPRPFPSMITATCLGRSPVLKTAMRSASSDLNAVKSLFGTIFLRDAGDPVDAQLGLFAEKGFEGICAQTRPEQQDNLRPALS